MLYFIRVSPSSLKNVDTHPFHTPTPHPTPPLYGLNADVGSMQNLDMTVTRLSCLDSACAYYCILPNASSVCVCMLGVL